jgi:hypothetical protein
MDLMKPPSKRRPTAALLAVALGLLMSGCGYGTLTVWGEPAEESPSDEEPSQPLNPTIEQKTPDTTAQACLRSGGHSAGAAPARLITSYEYKNTVRDLFGYDGTVTEDFPAENKVGGFENNISAHVASKLLVRKYMKASEKIAKSLVEDQFDQLLPCDPMQIGEVACGEQFVESFLRRAFRRPPSQGEVDDFVALFKEGRTASDFVSGIEMVIEGALQSPQFLYRIRFVDGGVQEGEMVALDGYEIASRLSYFLWASAPDEQLLEAAADGELQSAEQVKAQARRMLEDPRAKRAIQQFHRQWLHLNDFDSVVKDKERFPSFDPSMTSHWRQSVQRFVTDAYFGEDGTMEALLTSPTLYLTDKLATLYGRETKGEGLDKYTFPSEQRAGLLTQPGLMAVLASASQSSPIRRGVWVRERLFCQHIKPPPPGQNFDPPDPDPEATTREQFKEHTAKAQCASCHRLIDPIGFGFSNYDSMGRYRTEQNGRTVNNKGTLADTREPSIQGPFEGAVELADRVKRSDQVRDCLTSRWFQYALGRRATKTELCSLSHVQKAFEKADGDFQQMLVALAGSDAFRYRHVSQEVEEQ